jgi:hypothetical protein
MLRRQDCEHDGGITDAIGHRLDAFLADAFRQLTDFLDQLAELSRWCAPSIRSRWLAQRRMCSN